MNAISNIENKLSHSFDQAKDGAHHAMEQVSHATHQVAKTLDDKSHQLMKAQARLTKDCRNYVQEKPLSTVGIALASGLVLGWLLHKR